MLIKLEQLIPLALPIGALIVSASAVFISNQQWKLARHKLRLDLYDRRYKVYQALEDLLLEASTENDVETTTKLIDSTFNSAFLFDKKVVAYLDEILNRVHDHQTKTLQLRVLDPSHATYNKIH